MSSGTTVNMAEVSSNIGAGYQADPFGQSDKPSNHVSQRQQVLSLLWEHFRCSNYDARKYDWQGHENVGFVEKARIARGHEVPPGYQDAAGEMQPLSLRKPMAPYYLGNAIPKRFTSMLFSAKRHPTITCDDADTQDWLEGFAKATQLWAKMIRARDMGGAMGSIGVGFKFVNGKPRIELFDPRYSTPEFSDREEHTVGSIEVLYQFSEEVRNYKGEWVTVAYWYRRVVDQAFDTVWPKVLVVDGKEPDWSSEQRVQAVHGLPQCPVVWIQNTDTTEDTDGDPDCLGTFDMIEQIDALYSQASRGTLASCDPTLGIESDAEFAGIKKGIGNAVQVGKGETIRYLEMTGSGIQKATELAEVLEKKVLTMTRCVLDGNDGGPARTASEVVHNYSAMCDQADILRTQYGTKLKELLTMVLIAAKSLSKTRVIRDESNPRISRMAITLPKKQITNADGTESWVPRNLGDGEEVDFIWPKYFTTSDESVKARVDAAGAARDHGLIDTEHAIKYIANDFGIDNVTAMMQKLEAERKANEPKPLAHFTDQEFPVKDGETKAANLLKALESSDEPDDNDAKKDDATED